MFVFRYNPNPLQDFVTMATRLNGGKYPAPHDVLLAYCRQITLFPALWGRLNSITNRTLTNVTDSYMF